VLSIDLEQFHFKKTLEENEIDLKETAEKSKNKHKTKPFLL